MKKLSILRFYKLIYFFNILLLIFIPSCKPPPDEPEIGKINKINVYNIDNSGEKPRILSDTASQVLARAYGIHVIYSDTTFRVGSYLTFPNRITDIDVITLFDFDTENKSGSNMKEHFLVGNGNQNPQKISASIDKINKTYDHKFDLLIYKTPAKDTVFRFVVIATLEDGMKISDTTAPIKLLK